LIYFFIIYHIMVVFAWMFPYIFIITGGGPANTTTILELEIYRFAFQRALPALASTLAVLLLFGTMIFIFLQHRIRKMTD